MGEDYSANEIPWVLSLHGSTVTFACGLINLAFELSAIQKKNEDVDSREKNVSDEKNKEREDEKIKSEATFELGKTRLDPI